MVIAVNARFLVNGESEEYSQFIHETFGRITASHPDHTFIFIFDRLPAETVVFPANVITVVTGPQAKHPAQWYIWYNIKIPAVLKRYKVEVFLSPDGFCSLTTRIPQCLVVHDLAFLSNSALMTSGHFLFYKKFTPRFIKKAATVITLSEFIKTGIIQQYKTAADKIEPVYGGCDESFMPISIEERENVKAKYADGNEYFIYTGVIGWDKNLLNLLKAFSAFKKRQKSHMQLILAGPPGWKYETLLESLRLFRFKEEVKLLENPGLPGLVQVMASAYAMVYPPLSEGFGTQPLQAMKSGVPIIASAASAVEELCADAALYADPGNFKDIAVKMMLLFKDENLRKVLIEKGKLQSQKYNWDTTAKLVWKIICKTTNP